MTVRWCDPHRLPVPPTGYVRAVNPSAAAGSRIIQICASPTSMRLSGVIGPARFDSHCRSTGVGASPAFTVDPGASDAGRPQRDHRLAVGGDDRDARGDTSRGVRLAARRLLGPLAAQPPAYPRAPAGRPPSRRRRPGHARPADPIQRPPGLGRADQRGGRAPRSTAAASRSGSPRATPRSSTRSRTPAATPPLASGDG